MAKSPLILSLVLGGVVVAVAFLFATGVTGRNEPPPASSANDGDQDTSSVEETIDRTARFLAPAPDEDAAGAMVEDERPREPPAPRISAGGPLADEGWTYAWSTINRDSPTDSYVLLRRPGPPVEELSFWVREGRVRSRELGVDFVVVSADADAVVYFLPENPLHQYELERPRSDFFSAGRHASGRAEPGE